MVSTDVAARRDRHAVRPTVRRDRARDARHRRASRSCRGTASVIASCRRELPQRANIWALASLGVEQVISVSAVGSLREEIAPLHMVVPDQLIDRTRGRPRRSSARGIAAHIAFDTPFCPRAQRGCSSTRARDRRCGTGTTAARTSSSEGPAFSTRAESDLHRSWGAVHHRHDGAAGGEARPRGGACVTRSSPRDRLRHLARRATRPSPSNDPREPAANVGSAKTHCRCRGCGASARTDCALQGCARFGHRHAADLVPEDVKRDLAPILDARTRAGGCRHDRRRTQGRDAGVWTEYSLRRLEDRDAHPRRSSRRSGRTRRTRWASSSRTLFRQTRVVARDGGGHEALVLHSRGGLGHATFTMGEAGALDALLRVHPGCAADVPDLRAASPARRCCGTSTSTSARR